MRRAHPRGTAGRVDGGYDYDSDQRRGAAGEQDRIEWLDLEEQPTKRAAERERASEAESATSDRGHAARSGPSSCARSAEERCAIE